MCIRSTSHILANHVRGSAKSMPCTRYEKRPFFIACAGIETSVLTEYANEPGCKNRVAQHLNYADAKLVESSLGVAVNERWD